MLSINKNESIFVEKYRPKTIQDIILPSDMKTQLKEWIENDSIPNLLLISRQAGLGKSSLAHVIISETNSNAMFINISLERNLDVLRDKIAGFVSTSSFNNNKKIVVLDEFDGSSNILQNALRGFVEEFSSNAMFILTANYEEKIIEPIKNRFSIINFDEIFKNNKQELIKQTAKRLLDIIKYENIKADKEDVLYLVKKYYPSNRKILIELQKNITTNQLNIKKENNKTKTDKLIDFILKKDFDTSMNIVNNIPDPSVIFSIIYENIEKFPKTKIPQIIIIVAKYSAWDSQVRDRFVNSVACIAEIISVL